MDHGPWTSWEQLADPDNQSTRDHACFTPNETCFSLDSRDQPVQAAKSPVDLFCYVGVIFLSKKAQAVREVQKIFRFSERSARLACEISFQSVTQVTVPVRRFQILLAMECVLDVMASFIINQLKWKSTSG